MARRPRPGVKVAHKAVAHPVGKPTPEHAAQRAALAEGGDPAMTTIPIDVALLRGRLTREQHSAAKRYWFIWHAVVARSPNIQAVDLYVTENIDGDPAPSAPDPEAEQRLHDEFIGARKAVRNAASPGALEVIESMVIYEHWPSWCWASKAATLTALQLRHMHVATKAFDALEGYFSALYGRSNGKVRHTIVDQSQYLGDHPNDRAT